MQGVGLFGLEKFENEEQQESGSGEEGEEVGTKAEAEEKGDEEKPTLRLTVVGTAIPAEHGPEGGGGDEHGKAVDFAFDSGEPGCVAEEVAERADDGGGERYFFVGRGEEEDGPEEEHDGEASREGRERVAAESHLCRGWCKPRKDVGEKLVEGGSRGMAYLEEIGDGDKFATVPETDCGFECEEVNGGGEESQEPADYQFTTDLLKISSHSSVTISSTRACSTEEKSRAAL